MDPNTQQQPLTTPPATGPGGAPIDPKLQDAYNKVMNFTVAQNTPAGQTPPPPSAPADPLATQTPMQPVTPPDNSTSGGLPVTPPPADGNLSTPNMPPNPTTATDPMSIPTTTPTDPTTPPLNPADPTASNPQQHEVPSPTPPAPPSGGMGMFSTTQEAPQPSQPTTVVVNNETHTDTQKHDDKAHPQAFNAAAKKKGNPFMVILLFIGGLVFVALYAVIWVKIFNIKVPFLPF